MSDYYIIEYSSGRREIFQYYPGYPPPLPEDELFFKVLARIEFTKCAHLISIIPCDAFDAT